MPWVGQALLALRCPSLFGNSPAALAIRAMSAAAAPPSSASPQKPNLTEAAEAAGWTNSTISDELLARLKDKDLVQSAGFVDGKWLGARNNATYEVGFLTYVS